MGETFANDTKREIDIRIDHLVVMQSLSTQQTTETISNQMVRRYSYVGFLWLRTLPESVVASAVDKGYEVFVHYVPLELNVVPYLDTAVGNEGDENCTATPQGRCIECTNELPDYGYHIWTPEGEATGVCEFRCSDGAYYTPAGIAADGSGAFISASCTECDLERTCPRGQHAVRCTPTAPGFCSACETLQVCPAAGFYLELCRNGETVNPGCVQCTNAPPNGIYVRECEWQCPFGYLNILDTCVFAPPGDQNIAISLQMYLSSVFPAGQKLPSEPLFLPEQYRQALGTAITSATPDDVYLIRAVRVTGDIIDLIEPNIGTGDFEIGAQEERSDALNSRRRRLLQARQANGQDAEQARTRVSEFTSRGRRVLLQEQQANGQDADEEYRDTLAITLNGNISFTRADAYMWVDINAGTDPIQEILDTVQSGTLQADLSARHDVLISVAFVEQPGYVTGETLLQILEEAGEEPQGISEDELAGIREPRTALNREPPPLDPVLCAALQWPGFFFMIVLAALSMCVVVR